jgi:phosphatidylglycerol:prolipoprotein diacylglycerol transferase
VHPYVFRIGDAGLPSYGLLVALGLIAGLAVAARRARRDGINEEHAWNLGVYAILAGIVGAKILLVLTDFSYFAAHPRQIFSVEVLQAGGVWYGGAIGGGAVGTFFVWRYKLPILRTLDAFAPGLSLGHAIGRLGCFAAGCCYGKPTSIPWGVVFHDPVAAKLAGTPLDVKLHPTQLYEFFAEMCIFSFLLWFGRERRIPGQVMGAYIFIYGIARFFLEFLRGDPGRGSVFGGAMSATQLISIFIVIAGGMLWMKWGGARTAQPA